VHKLVVSIRSPYFKTAIRTPVEGKNKEEVVFDTTQTTVEVVRQAINFMYGINIKEGIIDHSRLLDIAEFLGMKDFKEEVDKYIVKNTKVSNDNLGELCELANKYSAPLLAEHCAKFLLGTTTDIAPAMAAMPAVTEATLRLARDTVQVVRSQKTKRCRAMAQCDACEGGKVIGDCEICGGRMGTMAKKVVCNNGQCGNWRNISECDNEMGGCEHTVCGNNSVLVLCDQRIHNMEAIRENMAKYKTE